MIHASPAPSARTDGPVLSVRDLQTHFITRSGRIPAVNGVSFDVAPGEILGLVGESGSGKSVTGFSIMGLVDEPGRIVGGQILFNGRDIVGLPEEEQRRLRGQAISMVFQDPSMTLNPVLRIDTQMIEAIQAHEPVSHAEARKRAKEALEMVGIPSPEERLTAYPFELSGGMRQRVVIAIALLNRPRLIIADEPTTALDVSIQGQIIYEVQKLCRETGTALIWITHDLGVVAGMADRVAVMYAGRLVETGTAEDVLERAQHPYTRGLIDSVPVTGVRGRRLKAIRGATPSLASLGPGCPFAERCDHVTAACAEAPPLTRPTGHQSVRCWNPVL